MKLALAIGIGSFAGGIIRYLLTLFIQTKNISSFPYGTFIVNIVGCLLIGLVLGLSEKGNISQEWRLILATGLIGGFTTFSAFSVETFTMIRDGQIWQGAAYTVASVLIGLFATFGGYTIIKSL